MNIFSLMVLIGHYFLISILCAYGAHRIYHTFLAKKKSIPPVDIDADDELPFVTVQAPVFNERFVIERLIDALANLDYPKDRLQIQIVDDSTDESLQVAAARIAHYRRAGINISHVLRDDRSGFKAGALKAAMNSATGEFIAIFDADFVPNADFLRRTIAQFKNPHVGMVQTRWEHLNTNSNTLTRVQSLILDAHFAVEQVARASTGAYFNFNGTAGIWRRQAIEDAGGWSADTITEDLDLSYRAQMKGWRFVYLKEVGCPSELPVDMCAFKTQQHRWAKGAIEVMKKILLSVWNSKASLHTKIEATFHLTGNVSYMLMLIDSLFFLLPSIHIREQAGWSMLTWLDIPIFLLASASHAWFFLFSQKLLYGRLSHKLAILPALLATSIGLSVNNGRAVIEALVGHVTGFVRTPKTGDETHSTRDVVKSRSRLSKESYKAFSIRWMDRLELILALFYSLYFIWAASKGYWVVLPFLALFSAGFFFTGYQSLRTKQQQSLKTT